jgi:uncharacterized protein YhaN
VVEGRVQACPGFPIHSLKITKFQRAIVDVRSSIFFFLFGALLVGKESCFVFIESLLSGFQVIVRRLLSFY